MKKCSIKAMIAGLCVAIAAMLAGCPADKMPPIVEAWTDDDECPTLIGGQVIEPLVSEAVFRLERWVEDSWRPVAQTRYDWQQDVAYPAEVENGKKIHYSHPLWVLNGQVVYRHPHSGLFLPHINLTPADVRIVSNRNPIPVILFLTAAVTVLGDGGLPSFFASDDDGETLPPAFALFRVNKGGEYRISAFVGDLPQGASNKLEVFCTQPPPTTQVPNVVGQTQTQATNTLTGVGLNVGSVTQEYSQTVAEGRVIRSNPTTGTTVQVGSSVNLVISRGVQPTFSVEGPGDGETFNVGEQAVYYITIPGPGTLRVQAYDSSFAEAVITTTDLEVVNRVTATIAIDLMSDGRIRVTKDWVSGTELGADWIRFGFGDEEVIIRTVSVR